MAKRTTRRSTESWLGATEPVGTLPIVLFVPSQDRDGREIDHDLWVTRALETLGMLFRARRLIRGPAVCGAMTIEAGCYGKKNRRL